ncbi:MAG: hypothetical protein ABEL97_13530 [Salinibacter sp.]
MTPRLSAVAFGLAVLLGVLSAAPTAAQHPADSIRAAALRDFHGPDLRGKDGPLAKAGLNLLVLYHEYQAFRRRGGDTFRPSVSGVRVRNGRVTVDAIAAGPAEQLRAALEDVGLRDAATAGRVVSGRLPIDSIPALATVEALRGVAPSRMRTHSDRARPSPASPGPPSPPVTASPDTASSDTSAPSEPVPPASGSPSQTGSAPPPDSAAPSVEEPAPDDEGVGTAGPLALLASAAGLLVLFLVFRR